MTVKKIRFSDQKENTKEKEKLKFSREKLLDLSKKKTFKASFLPNINSIKNEVNNFKKEREKWKKKDSSPVIRKNNEKENNILIKGKKTRLKKGNIDPKYNSKKLKHPRIKKPILKRKNTKKLNEIEIIVLFRHLCDLLERNRVDKITDILAKTKRKQIVQILNYFNIFKENTSAPIPLLKNVLFNLLFNDLDIS